MEKPVGNVNDIANERPKKSVLEIYYLKKKFLFFRSYSFYHLIAAEAQV